MRIKTKPRHNLAIKMVVGSSFWTDLELLFQVDDTLPIVLLAYLEYLGAKSVARRPN
jgi:hypothetical protein